MRQEDSSPHSSILCPHFSVGQGLGWGWGTWFWPLIHPLEFFTKLYPRVLGIQGTRCHRSSTYPMSKAPYVCPILLHSQPPATILPKVINSISCVEKP